MVLLYIACALTISDFEIVYVVIMLIWISIPALAIYIRHDFGHVKSRRQKRPSHHAYLEQCQHDNREEIQFTEKQLEESSPANYK